MVASIPVSSTATVTFLPVTGRFEFLPYFQILPARSTPVTALTSGSLVRFNVRFP